MELKAGLSVQNAVKAGYKNTEVGVIPDDWECVSMGEVGTTVIGLTYSPSNVKDYGLLVLRSSNIQQNQLKYKNNVFVDMEVPKRVIVKENDILICVRNGSKQLIGKCALIDKKAEGFAFGAFMSIYRSSFSKYIFYSFQSNIIQKQIDETMGATINQLTNKNLDEFKIALPPLPEQIAIASVISDTDSLIQALEKKIAKKQLIKKGAMQKLLSPKEGWEVKTLGEIAEIATGTTPPTKDVDNYGIEYCFVSPADLGCSKYIANTEKKLSKKGFNISRKFPKSSILFTCIGSTIGKMGIASLELTSNQQINAIYPNCNFQTEYLYYQLSLIAEKIKLMASEQALPMINKSEFSQILVSNPKLSEQTHIAQILSDMDSEIETLQKNLAKYKHLKQGLMQSLLTGKIRLI
ncbi:MAG: restriction endonuclease subunit S [Prolixibacteraceae bacterium]